MTRLILMNFLFMVILLSCKGQELQKQNLETLEIVWETMNTQYFDPDFSGLDWQGEYETIKPIITRCKSKDSLYYYLNKMLFKIGVSHLGVVSQEEVNTVGDPQLFFDGSAGMDLRYLDNKAIITFVQDSSSADKAGIKAGYELLEVGDSNISSIRKRRMAAQTPPFNERNRNSMITQDIIRKLYGDVGEVISIVYKDEFQCEKKVDIELEQQMVEKATLTPDLPPIYAKFYSKQIGKEIGYIRFDVFHPVLLDTIIKTISKYNEFPSLIIDIRGNPGGDFNTRRTIVNQFFSESKLFWTYKHRNEKREIYTQAVGKPYLGKVVILTDVLSGSSSEEFAGGMQDIGRAVIIGQQTAGKVLTMEFTPLPEGAFLIYPNSQTRTCTGRVLEGTGVLPDIKVELTQESVLDGKDLQLDIAISYLEGKKIN